MPNVSVPLITFFQDLSQISTESFYEGIIVNTIKFNFYRKDNKHILCFYVSIMQKLLPSPPNNPLV